MRRLFAIMSIIAVTVAVSFAQTKSVGMDVTVYCADEYRVQTKTRTVCDTVVKEVVEQVEYVKTTDSLIQTLKFGFRTKRARIIRVELECCDDSYIRTVVVLSDGTRHVMEDQSSYYFYKNNIGTWYTYKESYPYYEDDVITFTETYYRDTLVKRRSCVRRKVEYNDTTVVNIPEVTDLVCLNARKIDVVYSTDGWYSSFKGQEYCIRVYSPKTDESYWFHTTRDMYVKYYNKLYAGRMFGPTRKEKLQNPDLKLSYNDYMSISSGKAYTMAVRAACDNYGRIVQWRVKRVTTRITYETVK